MKKGFTLIELLAVILILGIIALIAIPTVNNIISEARYGAFKSGNENIMREVEQACQTNLMKGESPILSYLFEEGKSNYNIEVKGTLPNNGYILLDKECIVTDYYLTDDKNLYSNGDDIRQDYMLKEPLQSNVSIFKSLYPDYYENIINVSFVNHLDIPDNAIGVSNISVSGNGKVKSWLVPNDSKYDLYIGSLGKIYANPNSFGLFQNMTNVTSFDFLNLKTNFVNNFQYLFRECTNIEYLDINDFDVSNVTSIRGAFSKMSSLKSLNLSNWNTKKLKDMAILFTSGSLSSVLESVDFSNWDTSNVVDMSNLFYGCTQLKSVNLSSFKTSNTKLMYSMFLSCSSLTSIDLSNFDTKKVTSIENIFAGCINLKEVKLNNFILGNDTILLGIFGDCIRLEKIHINDINSLNKISQFITDRSSVSTGVILTNEDKTGLDINTLNNKNWNVI